MILKCTKTVYSHRGIIFEKGESYEIKSPYEFVRKVRLITNYDEYWKYIVKTFTSIKWIGGWNVVSDITPVNDNLRHMKMLYTKVVDLPSIRVVGNNCEVMMFSVMDGRQIKETWGVSKVCFDVDVKYVDEYFDYKSLLRTKKLDVLGL